MQAWIRARRAVFFASVISLATPAYAQTALDPGFAIEVFSDQVPFPEALAVPPAGSPFGRHLYVSSFDRTLSAGGGGPAHDILRIDLDSGEMETFFQLPNESSPGRLVFGPGPPFTTDLYITSNNRDGGLSGDQGGSIVHLAPNPAILGEQFLTPFPPISNFLSEPGASAFGPGGGFGTDLYVANAGDTPFDIATIPPAGQPRGTFVGFGTATRPSRAWNSRQAGRSAPTSTSA